MTVTEFFENLKNGAVWSAGVAFERTNPLPLDRYSVFKSKIDAETYASTNPVAYPGQVIAVISENEESKVFYINEAMALEPIGVIPVGEKGAINVDEKGNITLNGFADAAANYLPRVKVAEDGSRSLEWVPISDVVEGDTNTQTFGDGKTIDTVKDAELDKYTASLHGFKEAAENQIAHKVGDALVWKDEYKYDDTQVKTDIEKNTKAIGDSGSGLTKAVTDNTASIATNAQGIATNLESINAANSKIAKLETNLGAEGATGQKITALEQKDAQIDEALKARPTTEEVASQISAAAHLKRVVLESEAGLPAVESADANTIYMVPKATKATLLAEASDIYVEYMAIKGKWEIIGDTTVDLSEYAKTADMTKANEALGGRIDTVEVTANAAATNEALQAYIKKNDNAIGLKADQSALDAANQNIAKKLDTTTAESTYATKTALTEGLATKLDASEIKNYQTAEAAGAEITRVNEALGKKAENSTVEALTGRVAANEAAKADHTSRIDTLEKVGAEKNVINSANIDEFTISGDRELGIKAISQEKITGLTTALASKVAAVEGQRLMTAEEGTKLAHIAVGESNEASFDGKVEVANVNGLDVHITAQRETLAGLLSAENEGKLSRIADGAQVNILEKVQIEGEPDALAIADKGITLPKATAERLGLVKLSNEIGVDASGALTVKSVNVNTLTQSEGDTLILNGGNAKV